MSSPTCKKTKIKIIVFRIKFTHFTLTLTHDVQNHKVYFHVKIRKKLIFIFLKISKTQLYLSIT